MDEPLNQQVSSASLLTVLILITVENKGPTCSLTDI